MSKVHGADHLDGHQAWLNRLQLRAERGEPEAQHELANQYYIGRGIASDPAEARRWAQIAANERHLTAQHSDEPSYDPHDFILALKWYTLAAMQGHTKAAAQREYLAGRMTHAERREAQGLVTTWHSTAALTSESGPQIMPARPAERAEAAELESSMEGGHFSVPGKPKSASAWGGRAVGIVLGPCLGALLRHRHTRNILPATIREAWR